MELNNYFENYRRAHIYLLLNPLKEQLELSQKFQPYTYIRALQDNDIRGVNILLQLVNRQKANENKGIKQVQIQEVRSIDPQRLIYHVFQQLRSIAKAYFCNVIISYNLPRNIQCDFRLLEFIFFTAGALSLKNKNTHSSVNLVIDYQIVSQNEIEILINSKFSIGFMKDKDFKRIQEMNNYFNDAFQFKNALQRYKPSLLALQIAANQMQGRIVKLKNVENKQRCSLKIKLNVQSDLHSVTVQDRLHSLNDLYSIEEEVEISSDNEDLKQDSTKAKSLLQKSKMFFQSQEKILIEKHNQDFFLENTTISQQETQETYMTHNSDSSSEEEINKENEAYSIHTFHIPLEKLKPCI